MLVNILIPFTEKVMLQYRHISGEGKGPRPVLRIQRGGVETKTLFTWRGGPRSSGVGFFCFVSPTVLTFMLLQKSINTSKEISIPLQNVLFRIH